MSPTREATELAKIRGTYKPDTRKGDRHKPRKVKGGKSLSKWHRRRVIAYDGEGYTRPDSVHVYNLIADSRNNRLSTEDSNGLSTIRILMWLIQNNDANAINVIFGGSYDINMWLKDVPLNELEKLWQHGRCAYGPFIIRYALRKKFSVTLQTKGKQQPTFILWDVLGYFQTTFVEACRQWLGELPIFDEIERMKEHRSTFSVHELEDIIKYNQAECDLLVKITHRLFEALDECGIELTRFDGAGSIAAALMRKNNVKNYKGNWNIEEQTLFAHAYSGGRIEAVKVGNADSLPIHRYDICSAYPSIAVDLPDLSTAKFIESDKWDGQDFSLVQVRWNATRPELFYPLWYREPDGTIKYPPYGNGIYWGVEVKNLQYSYCDYKIERAWNFYNKSEAKPFHFIGPTYEQRLAFKQAHNMAHIGLKLGLNSIYGKVAQQAGYRNGRLPTYHQLAWAGYITAATRAKMYQAAIRNADSVIAFATDAIISTQSLSHLDLGNQLGQWDYDKLDGITLVQAGVYWLCKDGDWQAKYRGFDKGSLDRKRIIEIWREGVCPVEDHKDCLHYPATLTRFVGLGSALMMTDFYSHWRRWETQERLLDLIPDGKRKSGQNTCFDAGLCDTIAAEVFDAELMSSIYPIEWISGKIEKPTIDGIPVDILEKEELDSYA